MVLSDQFVTSWEELVNFDRLRGYRTERVTSALRDADFDGLVSFKADNVRYISSVRPLMWEAGYQTRNLVIVDAAGNICLYIASGDYQRVLQNDPWLKDVKPLASLEDAGISLGVVTDQLIPQLRKMGLLGKRLALDATTFYTESYVKRALANEGSSFGAGDDLMLRAREVKSPDESRLIHAAAGIVDGGLSQASESIRDGRTENAVAGAALRVMYGLNTEWMPMNPVVFSGRGPFRKFATDKMIRRGDLVVVDLSAMHDGYCAEATRTFPAGRATAGADSLLASLRSAYDEILDRLTPGVRLADVARSFSKRLGTKMHASLKFRGAGLSLAELPDGPSETGDGSAILRENAVLVAEVRFEDPKAGVGQISDTIHIGPAGPELLTRFQEGR